MPMTTKSGKVRKEELPETIRKSPAKAQRTFAKAHDAAVEQYGEGERAHRTAFAALKHSYEKVGDHWEPKGEKGPSDPRSTKTTIQKRRGVGETFGGVDLYGNTKDELYARAKKLGVAGRSRMSKTELARAIAKKQK
jgi:cation transport regulator ChaB